MENTIISIIENFGYIGVLALIAIENIFPPIPSEVILLFAGFATSRLNLNIYWLIICATLGSLCGAAILYYIGKLLNIKRLKKLINSKFGKILRLKETDIDIANDWFTKKGVKAVFLCRFIPIIRSLISIPAGINNMNFLKFNIYTGLAALFWNVILIVVGNKIGNHWNDMALLLDEFTTIVMITIVISIIGFVLYLQIKRKKQ